MARKFIDALTAGLALTVLTGFTAGCQSSKSVNTTEPAFSRSLPQEVMVDNVITDSSLEDEAQVISVTEGRTPGGLMRIQVEIYNSTRKRQEVNYQIEWFDDQGIIIDSPMTSWKRLSIPGNSSEPVTAVAPSPRAADFRIKLAEPGA
jgi:uncharacterized protein YcfL